MCLQLLENMDTSFLVKYLICFVVFHLHGHFLVWAAMDSCYDEEGNPSSCMPKFENIAFNRTVNVSNVCGSPPEDYCMQTGSTRSCHICDATDPAHSHNAGLLTDFHRNEDPTWWQSQSMYYGIQHPNSINLTLHLGKEKTNKNKVVVWNKVQIWVQLISVFIISVNDGWNLWKLLPWSVPQYSNPMWVTMQEMSNLRTLACPNKRHAWLRHSHGGMWGLKRFFHMGGMGMSSMKNKEIQPHVKLRLGTFQTHTVSSNAHLTWVPLLTYFTFEMKPLLPGRFKVRSSRYPVKTPRVMQE